MSLFKCDICGQTVSDKATICPHCGNVLVKPQYKDRVRYRDYIKRDIQ